MQKKDLNGFENNIKIKFLDKGLLERVFIHRSFLNEHKNVELEHNERLEFLGDAVLELVVTEYLYKKYPNPEGELTNWRSALVKGESLSRCAKSLKMDDFLMLSRGEQGSTGKARQLILANSFEALIGAIYLDQGYKTIQSFIAMFLLKKLSAILKQHLYIDAKSKLQEIAQEKYAITPNYQVISESGPDHNKLFIMGVYLDQKKLSEGKGLSKQEAEQDAAKGALDQI